MNQNSRAGAIGSRGGFTLPAVLVIVAALLIIAMALLAVTGIERRTARSYVEQQRAEMAAKAGLEELMGVLNRETANDDFLVISEVPEMRRDDNRGLEAVPYLYLARGESSGSDVRYRYHPLFSVERSPAGGGFGLDHVPEVTEYTGEDPATIESHPYMNSAHTAWVPIRAKKNGREQTVGRYAYWVEDLQGKVNAKVAGNLNGDGNTHARGKFPFPAPGINPRPLGKDEPALNGIAIHALDPKAKDKPENDLVERIVDGRPWMLSPESILGAAGFAAPIRRGDDGKPEDPVAAAIERDVSGVIQPYEEKPVIPYARGISPSMAGKPKLNLNKLLSEERRSAINRFAGHIDAALPNFVGRQGGFGRGDELMYERPGDDYLKTLAANALDYADEDSDPSLEPGVYRGLDSYPMLSELVLKIEYLGTAVSSGTMLAQFRFTLYGELWNMTNHPVSGRARLSYEVALPPEGTGAGVGGTWFSDSSLLSDKQRSAHDLEVIDGRYFSKSILVSPALKPDEYRVLKFATVNYRLPVGPSNMVTRDVPLNFVEEELDARGISFMWNEMEVERISRIVRDPDGVSFKLDLPKVTAKAAIPGHGYGPFGDFTNNMGDPRMSHYLRTLRLSENAFPGNVSPNRRNVRRKNVYNYNTANFYGRVLPSEWPDGGHDSFYGNFPAIPDGTNAELDSVNYRATVAPEVWNAPQRISNLGRFYSATELGHIYDPIMWTMAYEDLPGQPGSGRADSNQLKEGSMPGRRNRFPDVTDDSVESTAYGGGNTLRVGRYEHPRFDREYQGMRAAFLLDLFHAGKSTSDDKSEREGEVVDIYGHINVNTASKDVLRAMAAGMLGQDEALSEVTSWTHEVNTGRLAPKVSRIELGTPSRERAADIIAEAMILRRPFGSMGALAGIRTEADEPVFGNPGLYTEKKDIQWSDAAAEELFARIHDAATLRSRNFRVWVVGQSVSGPEDNLEVVAESRKVFTVFADPGERNRDGTINGDNNRARVIYERNF